MSDDKQPQDMTISPVIALGVKIVSMAVGTAIRFCTDRRRPKLIFIDQPQCGWSISRVREKPIISLQLRLGVTNPHNRDGIVIARVQLRQIGFLFSHEAQDCYFCDIAGQRAGFRDAQPILRGNGGYSAAMEAWVSRRSAKAAWASLICNRVGRLASLPRCWIACDEAARAKRKWSSQAPNGLVIQE